MTFITWLLLLPFDWIMTIVSYPFAPLVAALADKNGQPPRWLRWFSTYDNTMDGDEGWRTIHCPAYRSWWCRTKWLWRNPIGTFDHEIAGRVPDISKLIVRGNPSVSNRPLTPGWLWVRCANCWMLYVVIAWPGNKRCLRMVLGWKLSYVAQRRETRGVEPIVFAINPVMGAEVY